MAYCIRSNTVFQGFITRSCGLTDSSGCSIPAGHSTHSASVPKERFLNATRGAGGADQYPSAWITDGDTHNVAMHAACHEVHSNNHQITIPCKHYVSTIMEPKGTYGNLFFLGIIISQFRRQKRPRGVFSLSVVAALFAQ